MTARHLDASDEDLVRRWREDPGGRAGRAAVDELFGRYDERVYAWCFRFCRDHERALDLAQEAQLEAFRSLDTFEGRARFSTWLFTVTRYRCLRTLRRPGLLRDEGLEPDALPAGGDPPDEALAREQEDRRLLALMDAVLDARERQALWLRCQEGMPVETITEVLGVATASGARGLLQTARRKLRAALAARPGEEAGT
jgi:RNA polymerase sigma-70 factor (ECF subfamily)